MSEPGNINDSEQEMQELSNEEIQEKEKMWEEGKQEEFPSMVGNTVEEENTELHAEGNSGGNGSGPIQSQVVPNPSEKITNDTRLPSESQEGTEVHTSIEPPANDSGQTDGSDEKNTEEEPESSKEQLENGNKLVVTETKDIHSKENQFDGTPSKEARDETHLKEEEAAGDHPEQTETPAQSFNCDPFLEGDDDGSEEMQAAFMIELENFHKERSLEFKPPKFYGEGLNCLKLWRAVTRLGGYDQVTSCKLWRQVGESFKPPKTCTTVSWSFRCFYEKALLEYEKHKIRTGELRVPIPALPEAMSVENQIGVSQASGSGRARRDAAARAMQGWHSRLLGNGEVGDPIIKDKTSISLLKWDKHHKNIGGMKRKKGSTLDHAVKVSHKKVFKPQVEATVVDVGQPADWVKINVKKTKDCFEVYALVPGLLREEVHVQSDPAGRLIISGEPEQPDNPWGVTPFKKVVTLPSRIDPHQTSAVVTLHGQLFVRAPFEQSDL
ncbi:AT-rich interactive domain-containing protein 5-like isoform X2 [Asparagus officinalis]|uniref:AT-rich interactive domain-containing protein 5-like isoform X2 n=1 Tax=Asparagus officinalis TaxID=4686 RepID=UPI00098E6ABF|nr:AT-rich interactive domain-containing protein 5-like isoform X2 [Asparagus officinalis]